MRVQGQTPWNGVFQNAAVVIPVIRPSRGRAMVAEVLGGPRPDLWVSDRDSAQRGQADAWQIGLAHPLLAHPLRDLRDAVDTGGPERPRRRRYNNGSERELRPMATYRKVTGGFRSDWGPDLCAALKSVIGTAARRGLDPYHAILSVLSGRTVLASS